MRAKLAGRGARIRLRAARLCGASPDAPCAAAAAAPARVRAVLGRRAWIFMACGGPLRGFAGMLGSVLAVARSGSMRGAGPRSAPLCRATGDAVEAGPGGGHAGPRRAPCARGRSQTARYRHATPAPRRAMMRVPEAARRLLDIVKSCSHSMQNRQAGALPADAALHGGPFGAWRICAVGVNSAM